VDDSEGGRDYTQLALLGALVLLVAVVVVAIRCA
jgi:hypothetical protein